MTEFTFIQKLANRVKTDRSIIVGIGDDTAVLEYRKDRFLLLTTDMITEGTHFLIGKATPYQIGWKAMAVNVSDIAAMGGLPRWAVVSLGGPFKNQKAVGRKQKAEDKKQKTEKKQQTTDKFIWEIYRGMNAVGKKFGVHIVGGDTDNATKWTMNVTLLGEVEKKYLKLRSGAKVGDRVFVTGTLGGAIQGKHLRFTPRIREARYLVSHYPVTSMMDLSDGLASDLRRLISASKVGALVEEEKIPLSKSAKNIRNAFCDGEDFELLFTLPMGAAGRLEKEKIPWISHIGEITSFHKGFQMKDRFGKVREVTWQGFEHF